MLAQLLICGACKFAACHGTHRKKKSSWSRHLPRPRQSSSSFATCACRRDRTTLRGSASRAFIIFPYACCPSWTPLIWDEVWQTFVARPDGAHVSCVSSHLVSHATGFPPELGSADVGYVPKLRLSLDGRQCYGWKWPYSLCLGVRSVP